MMKIKKPNNQKKNLPGWFSWIWFFGIISTSVQMMITILPSFKKEQWAIAHGLYVFFIPGIMLFLFCIIALPIFVFIKKIKLTRFQFILLFLTSIIVFISLVA